MIPVPAGVGIGLRSISSILVVDLDPNRSRCIGQRIDVVGDRVDGHRLIVAFTEDVLFLRHRVEPMHMAVAEEEACRVDIAGFLVDREPGGRVDVLRDDRFALLIHPGRRQGVRRERP